MTTRQNVRKDFARYQPPTLFGGAPSLDELPSQARPASKPEPSRPIAGRIRPDLVEVGGQLLEVCVSEDPHQPGIGTARRRIFDLHGSAIIEARVTTYPDGPRCSCRKWQERRECGHVLALVTAGHLPEVGQLDTWTIAHAGEV